MKRTLYLATLLILTGSLVQLTSCSKDDTDPGPSTSNDPIAGSRWVFHYTETVTGSSPSTWEGDFEWVAEETTIDGQKWLGIVVNYLPSGSNTIPTFAIRRGIDGWRCKIINTPKEGLWIPDPSIPGQTYYQTHPPAGDNPGFSTVNYGVFTEVVDVKSLTTTDGIVWQQAINAAFSETTHFTDGDVTQSQTSNFNTYGVLLISNHTYESNTMNDDTRTTQFEIKSFTR